MRFSLLSLPENLQQSVTMAWLMGPFTVAKPSFGMEVANLNRVLSDEELQTYFEAPRQRALPVEELAVLRSTASHPDFPLIEGLPKRLPFSRPQSTDDLANSCTPLGLDRMCFQCDGPFSGGRFSGLEDPPEMSDDEEEADEEDCGDEDDEDVSMEA